MTDVRRPDAIPEAILEEVPGAPGVDAGAAPPSSPPRSPGPPRRPRRPRDLTPSDAGVMVGCFLSSLALCWLVFSRLTGGIGWLGYGLCVFVVGLVLLYIVTTDAIGRDVAIDRVVTAIVIVTSVVLLVALVFLLVYVVSNGIKALRITFFFKDQRGVTPVMPSTAGGGSHAIIGTLEQVGLALLWSVPLGLLAAIFLNESRSKWRRPVRIFVDAMSGLPSVIAGLFIYAVFVLPYARTISLFSFNGFMASLALAMIMLPTITRTVEVVLRLVPDGLRESSLALGSSRARMVWSVVLPTARTGITTAVVLGVARAVGETAPLIFTAFGFDLMNANPFKGPQDSLPLFVYKNILKPSQTSIERAYAGALVLMLLVLGLFGLARYIGRDRTKATARRTARRARRRARRDRTPNPTQGKLA